MKSYRFEVHCLVLVRKCRAQAGLTHQSPVCLTSMYTLYHAQAQYISLALAWLEVGAKARYGYHAQAQARVRNLDTYVQEVTKLRPSWGWSKVSAGLRGDWGRRTIMVWHGTEWVHP